MSGTFRRFGDEGRERYPAASERLRALLQGRCGVRMVAGDMRRSALYDDSGVIEVPSSARAGEGQVSAWPPRAWCLPGGQGPGVWRGTPTVIPAQAGIHAAHAFPPALRSADTEQETRACAKSPQRADTVTGTSNCALPPAESVTSTFN
ncbi:hypothetical protein ACFOLJ_22815 [Rugamonas sp. CCM 8940]|uniref:hypothetical protein n=1 Tax=Rugamonas sp. CCM 8940 TaxID=2765359 RepID=UPI0018F2E5F6|nr:hypothetical protein [Rugamonas sp. CCM 8940]MBJ7312518.1 hypothetical protein [Rugamonas sp. CCM 8940]